MGLCVSLRYGVLDGYGLRKFGALRGLGICVSFPLKMLSTVRWFSAHEAGKRTTARKYAGVRTSLSLVCCVVTTSKNREF